MGLQPTDVADLAKDTLNKMPTQDIPKYLSDVKRHPVPYRDVADEGGGRPVWRVRFELASDPDTGFELEVDRDIVLGRGPDAPGFFDLSPYGADEFGVSRRHLVLRPASTSLSVFDLGSRNGTWQNDHPIKAKTPCVLSDEDHLSLGSLEFAIKITRRPKGRTAALHRRADLAEALTETAKAITSQLEIDEVLSQVVETVMSLTSAGEVAVWLVDRRTGELFLEAERGIKDKQIRGLRLSVPDTLLGQVVDAGEPLRANCGQTGEQIKVKTGYMVDALLCVPLRLGNTTFGVLVAAHCEPGKGFSKRDEKILTAIGDLAAVAIENARLFEVESRRTAELSALYQTSLSITSSLDLQVVLDAVLESTLSLPSKIANARIYLYQDDRLTFGAALRNGHDGQPAAEIPPGSIAYAVAHQGQPMVARDMPSHVLHDDITPTCKGSVVGLPLKIGQRVVGVMIVRFPRSPRAFSEAELRVLDLLGSQAAIAIENARLYEESNTAYEELQKADRLKNEMLQNVSHEFRTPLTFIAGYVELMLDEAQESGSLTPEQQEQLGIVSFQTQKLVRLLDNFYLIHSLETRSLEREQVDLITVLKGAVASTRLRAAEREIGLSLRLDGVLPLVMIDRMAIAQVLDNLLTNALKFTEPGGKVEVRAWPAPMGKKVYVSVSDTGIGIPDGEHGHIFERFYQVDGTMTRRYGGVGLGLAVCKEIVEAHGENIWVESTPGEGTTFTFTLPIV